jgi:hypothetical protein
MRLPCPRSADHLVVSQVNFERVFGKAFETQFVESSKSGSERQRRVFELMRTGYEALWKPAVEGDVAYVKQRTTGEGEAFRQAKEQGVMVIGVHVRRGDGHPWEKEFEGDYLPLERYLDEVSNILTQTYGPEKALDEEDHPKSPLSTTPLKSTSLELLKRRQQSAAHRNSLTILASDDPTVYETLETAHCLRAQDRILLASKKALESMAGSRPIGPLDTLHGWEGGFFKNVFLSLGREDSTTRIPPTRPRLMGRNVRSEEALRLQETLRMAHAAAVGMTPQEEVVLTPGLETLALRAIVGRAYLLDLMVLAKADRVVCAASSAACRVLGVMMGWDAVKEGSWRNIDGGINGWVGMVVR